MQLEGLKITIKDLDMWTHNGNCTLFYEKPTHAAIVRVNYLIEKYEQGERVVMNWRSQLQTILDEQSEVDKRYFDLFSKIEEISEISTKLKVVITTIGNDMNSEKYNINTCFQSFNLLNKMIEVLLSRTNAIRSNYPGLISLARPSSMILDVKLLEIQGQHFLESLSPKKVEELDNKEKTKDSLEYIQDTVDRFLKGKEHMLEVVSSHQTDTNRRMQQVVDDISEIIKSLD